MNARLRLLLQLVGVAAIYFAAAKVALLLAIPPGYATPVWPPAGIALAALMRGGPRLWPAILVGAVAVNFSIQESLPAALAIGAGNTLEALLGALAAQRFFVRLGYVFAGEVSFAGRIGLRFLCYEKRLVS